MTAGLFAQYAVIALAVLASLAYVVRAQWPGAVRSARVACALSLMRATRPAWVQRVGRRIAPAATAGSRCGGCSNCD